MRSSQEPVEDLSPLDHDDEFVFDEVGLGAGRADHRRHPARLRIELGQLGDAWFQRWVDLELKLRRRRIAANLERRLVRWDLDRAQDPERLPSRERRLRVAADDPVSFDGVLAGLERRSLDRGERAITTLPPIGDDACGLCHDSRGEADMSGTLAVHGGGRRRDADGQRSR